ncbi:type I-F CRISPR-associated endoribonuclease Cas6/Csy4 [Vibrio mangrovi]|uniref:CRISPR-associated endonuclease Cas6/Csy4 n=1 Tax=Vibrio mangrovi TaxID=474394 RepID=A0A1Y6J3M2_9VIBR|nr:type I-F CRISPR-associated endoribonuclease Cas6/Csy4 [Vibrio mangrovi]MDW6005268.1 type I-F CRISPR-associated endoribonuclease Cas6/Csy4 [Vibrio mangrovi]SMS02893.1 CRISPR-associated endonuclease Cas6/Csy4 [Vibrio mangrovi]
MDYYLDIQVEPDPEMSAPVLINHLFAKFHRVMMQICPNQIGVSFPHYGKTLGSVLRLHGTQTELETLMAENWLKGLRDYTCVSPIQAVPDCIHGYCTFSRIQQKSPHNMRKRSIAKGWLTPEEALTKIPDSQQKCLALPYLQLQSLSNKQVMRIFVQRGELNQKPVSGSFSSYGLSRSTTVPWF